MHTSRVSMLRGVSVFGGEPASIHIDGDQITFEAQAGESALTFEASGIKRGSFNPSNGMWVLRLKDGRKVKFQSAGGMLSADRTPEGKETNRLLQELMRAHGARRFP